jgi:hypothetical protein
MIRIAITASAYAAIQSTLSKGAALYPTSRTVDGYFVHMSRTTLNHLTAMRKPGEGYSEVILRLAQGWEPAHVIPKDVVWA